MSLFLLTVILALAITSLSVKKTVTAIIAFASMMFLLGIYYMLLDEKLLGILQIFVYTGGIVVLMLFGITAIGTQFPENSNKKRGWAILFILIIFASFSYLIISELPNLQDLDKNNNFNNIDNLSQFLIIFALIGSSLIYGTIKMVSVLKGEKEEGDLNNV
jgi:NADH-quinone oxidoreductase subunit J